MDSYIHSSAVNRHHYALVHKLENSASVQEADSAIWAEIDRIKSEFARGKANVRDELVILMYCHTASGVNHVKSTDLDFALSPAVNLAATGRAVKDRRIGLSFCAQFMPPTHPLQLMLVNTLRKEIESDEPARIALAIDFIIACPTQFIGPAVAARLEVLLGHKTQNLRHRALLALRALSAPHADAEDPHDSESYLAQHAPTVIRRLTRAAREDRVRPDEIGAIGALLLGAKDLLRGGILQPKDVIPPVAALLEKIILAAKHDRTRPAKLVTPLLATLHSAVPIWEKSGAEESLLVDLAKLIVRVIYTYADRPASPQVLQSFRLLGVLPVRIVHSILKQPPHSHPRSPEISRSPGPSQSPRSSPRTSRTRKSDTPRRHPALVLRPLISSREPTERWVGLECLECLDVRLWAGVPLKGKSEENKEGAEAEDEAKQTGEEDLIPPVFDEWEVGIIMRGLSDPDQTIRKLTMRVLYKVDPQLIHAFLEQLITPPPAVNSTSPQPRPVDALEVLSFLCADDGGSFARGVGRVLDVVAKREEKGKGKAVDESKRSAVDEKLVEAVVLVVHESDARFRAGFAEAMLERIEHQIEARGNEYGPGSLISPVGSIGLGSPTPASSPLPNNSKQADPTSVLLFATTAIDVSSGPHRAVDVLLSMLPGRGAGIQEVLLLAALRLVPRLGQLEIKSAKERVDEFGKNTSLSRHMQRRCEMFVRFVQDIDTLKSLVDGTRGKSLPEFLQALLSYSPPQPTAQASKPTSIEPHSTSPTIPKGQQKGHSISPEFSTVSLSNSPALRYDAYAAPKPAPRRNRPELKSPFHRDNGDVSTASDSQFDSGSRDGESNPNQRKHSGGHLRLELSGSREDDRKANQNADLITLSALESPFRAETDFRTLSMDDSELAHRADSTTTSSPPFHTAVMTSPRFTQANEGGDLAPADADAIWGSFDVAEADAASTLGRQTLRGWCERTPESMGNALRGIGVGFVTQKVGHENAREKEVFAFIPAPADSPDTEVARAVVRLKPAEDGSCLWMLRCVDFELRVKIRKALDGDLS